MIRTCSLALAALVATTPAFAQTDAEKIQARVKANQHVSITDDQGKELRGKITTLTADGITLLQRETVANVPYDHVMRIDRPFDSLRNGTLIGFGIGAGTGIAMTVAARAECYPGFTCPGQDILADLAGGLLFGGIGAAVGAGLDALIGYHGAIYRRNGAVVTAAAALRPGARSAVVSVSW